MADDQNSDTPKTLKKVQLSKKKGKPAIDLNPTIPGDKEIKEGAGDSARLDQLIRDGLGDKNNWSQYRRALSDPDDAVNNVQLRPLVGKALEKLLDLIMDDSTLYNRIRQVLLKERHEEIRDNTLHDTVIEAAVRRRQSRNDK